MTQVVTNGKYGTEWLQDQREKLNMYEMYNNIRNVTEIRYRLLKNAKHFNTKTHTPS